MICWRSEAAFDQQVDYGRELEESFRYQNTMSNGTTQERVNIILELRQVEAERQAQREQLAAQLRQVEELQLQIEPSKKLELSQQQELTKQEQKRSHKLSRGM